jgi:hypothetical protein
MTTIAWDGKYLVGDRQSTWGGTPTKTKKIFKALHKDGHKFIYGCAGMTGECQAFTQWANGCIEKPVFTDIQILAIDDAGAIWHANQSMLWTRLNVKFWAIGSGCDYALAAMACGKSARAAVKIAMIFDVNTGLGMDSMTI